MNKAGNVQGSTEEEFDELQEVAVDGKVDLQLLDKDAKLEEAHELGEAHNAEGLDDAASLEDFGAL